MSGIDSLGDVRGKRVLVRSDLNVPLDGDVITDDGRIRASVPTISELADGGARHYADCIRAIKARCPQTAVEALTLRALLPHFAAWQPRLE